MSDSMDPIRKRIKELENQIAGMAQLELELKRLKKALAAYEGPKQDKPSCTGYPCRGCDECRGGPDYR